jgi:hypothetical protein
VVLDFGSTWKYLATGGDQQSAWRATAFDDGAWPSGQGDLGFRNGNTTTVQQTTGRTTYYFRTSFAVAAGDPVTTVVLDLKRDDGAVVYFNGIEVARSNMPSGTVGFTTRASAAVNGSAEDQAVAIHLPPSAVVTGANSIAVEVHQRSKGGAADLTMDARVTLAR